MSPAPSRMEVIRLPLDAALPVSLRSPENVRVLPPYLANYH
jgi:hypothetical protein